MNSFFAVVLLGYMHGYDVYVAIGLSTGVY